MGGKPSSSSAKKPSYQEPPQPKASKREEEDDFDQMTSQGTVVKKVQRAMPKDDLPSLLDAARHGFAYQLAEKETEDDVEKEILSMSRAPPVPKPRQSPEPAGPELEGPGGEFGLGGEFGADAEFGDDIDLNASRGLRRLPKPAPPAAETPPGPRERRASMEHAEQRFAPMEGPPAAADGASVRRFSSPTRHDEGRAGFPHQPPPAAVPPRSPVPGGLSVSATGSLRAGLEASAAVSAALTPGPRAAAPALPHGHAPVGGPALDPTSPTALFLARRPSPGSLASPEVARSPSPGPARGGGQRGRIVTAGGVAQAGGGPRQNLNLASYQLGLVT
eukprot:tig00000900_g5388.t1